MGSDLVTRIDRELARSGIDRVEAVELVKAGFLDHFTDFLALYPDAESVGDDAPEAAREVRLRLRRVRVASRGVEVSSAHIHDTLRAEAESERGAFLRVPFFVC